MISDEVLMLQYREGDIQAFETLYTRHKGPLYRYLLHQLRDRAITDDLFQEIWLNLIRSRERYEHKARFTTWLYCMARNRLIDHYRSQKRGISFSSQEEHDVALLQADDCEQPERKDEVTRDIDHLFKLLDQLPEAQREAFLLKEESGMTLEEIAKITNSNPETVKSRLRYAVGKLRAGLRGDHEE